MNRRRRRNTLLLLLLFYSIHAVCANRSPSKLPQSKPKNSLKSIHTDCNREHFHINLDLGKPFKGIVFAKEFSDECRVKGNMTSTVSITLPTSSCGVRMIPRENDMMEMAVRIIIQMDGKLRQQVDMEKNIRCILPSDMMGMEVEGMMANVIEKKSSRINVTITTTHSQATPRVRVWLELGSSNGAGVVEVGQATTLGIRALLPGNIGAKVVDCNALDGLGETSQKLLDDRGCPVDEQVMPALLVRQRPAEEGWSKPNEDDLVERLFTSTFPAFKFPDRERLHVQCSIQLCNGNCPHVDCKRNDPFVMPSEKQLARIEVFNSLAVSAPQIELDRYLQKDLKEDGNINEIRARRQKSEGVLCLSSSKLAMAFAVLGLIFLLAMIVAVICMLKARVDRKKAAQERGSIFSSGSSTQSSHTLSHPRQFGTKLLIPYGSGSLPYGRVY
ncbi:cuticlin-6 [Culicoides brevitarsis]|uniref:cuticlin-6 n=1 Tax=Culicoides brevitarsis TaxID=469753 RepID=UPI00307BEA7D